jgi:hypothetical protein
MPNGKDIKRNLCSLPLQQQVDEMMIEAISGIDAPLPVVE